MRIRFKVIFIFFPLLLCSCSSVFTSRSIKEPMMTAYLSGNIQEAERIANEYAESCEGTGDELMWRLEQAKIKFDSGNFKESLLAFEKAEKIVVDFDERAKISAREGVSEIGAAFTNPNALPYRGFIYDRVLINAYKSLCYLAFGDRAGAVVEIRRMHQRQKEAKEYFEAEINSAEEKIKAERAKMSEESAQSAGDFSSIIEANPGLKKSSNEVKKLAKKVYGDFINPFSLYLSAIIYLLESDYNNASVDFRNLYMALPDHQLVSRDFLTASKAIGANVPAELAKEKPWEHSMHKNVVFVIFENGIIAALKEEKLQIILPPPIPTGYSGIAFPSLEAFAEPFCSISVEADGQIFQLSNISEMDAVLGSEFNEIFPYIITRLVISTVLKEAASYAAQMAAEESGGELAKWGTVVGASIYKYIFNTADTRCWQTLPKKYMITHFPKPKTGKLKINAGTRSEILTLSDHKKFTIVYIRAPSVNFFSVKVFEF